MQLFFGTDSLVRKDVYTVACIADRQILYTIYGKQQMSRGLSLRTCQMRHEADPESTEKTEYDGTEAKMQQGNLSRNQSADKLKGMIQMQRKTHSISHKTGEVGKPCVI